MKAQVLLPKIFNFSFTYNSNNILLKTGDLVEVPFGKNKEIGVIWKNINTELKNIKIKNINKKILVITAKQNEILAKDFYSDKGYESLLNTLQLMSSINTDLGIGYIGQIIERKEKLELLIKEPYKNNSKIVGTIQLNNDPTSPNKQIIVFFGLFIGLLLSLSFIFIREFLLDENK